MPYSNPASSPRLSELFSLRAKTALVIGGAGLIGSEIAFGLAELGANVAVASRNGDNCRKRAEEIAEKFPDTRPFAMVLDISDPRSIKSAVKKAGDEHGIDILVNSGWSGRKNTLESISNEDWDNDIEICLNGVFRTIKAALPYLTASRGVVLNIASMYGHVSPDYRLYDSTEFANPPSYGAAKAGVIQLTRYCASFLSPHGIRVNAISPGPFPFETTQRDNPEFIDRLAAKNPLGRIGKPHELKAIAALLCSDASSYMTGQNVCVDGGWAVW